MSYVLIVASVFLMGIYLWKLFNKNYYRYPFEETERKVGFSHQKTLLQVGDTKITQDDIDWEVKLHLAGTLLPTVAGTSGGQFRKDAQLLLPLKERLMAGLVERKLLYRYAQQDSRINLADPSLYSSCMNEWQDTLREATEIAFNQKEKEKLKGYLCEKSIIEQYLDKFIFSKIRIEDKDIAQYYKNHLDEFKKPKRAVIRQIVLVSEPEAKSLLSKLNANNFGEYAAQYSISPEGEKGGRLGPFSKGEMPQVFDVAFSMEPGQISTILKSTYGFHIILLEKVLSDNVSTMQDARKEIEKSLTRIMREEEYKKIIELALDAIHVGTPKPLF